MQSTLMQISVLMAIDDALKQRVCRMLVGQFRDLSLDEHVLACRQALLLE